MTLDGKVQVFRNREMSDTIPLQREAILHTYIQHKYCRNDYSMQYADHSWVSKERERWDGISVNISKRALNQEAKTIHGPSNPTHLPIRHLHLRLLLELGQAPLVGPPVSCFSEHSER